MPRKYQPTKVPTQKVCLSCRNEILKNADYCPRCLTLQKEANKAKKILDEEYRLALLKHKL